jgi:hypothetical protein
MTALLTTAQRSALGTLAAAAPSAYMTISAAELAAALATIDALEAAITTAVTEAARLRAALNRQAPLIAAAEALADCHAWVAGATTEAEDDQACAAFDAAADVVVRQVATLRGAAPPALPATSLPSLLAAAGYPAAGAWLLSQACPAVEYEQPDRSDPIGLPDCRLLDLRGFDRVIVVAIDGDGTPITAGLSTLLPIDGYCRVCGCSQENACESAAGPCGWAEPDLCTRCAGGKATDGR